MSIKLSRASLPKFRKNPMHGICGAESHRYTRHLGGDAHGPTRRHNEERRADLIRRAPEIAEAQSYFTPYSDTSK